MRLVNIFIATAEMASCFIILPLSLESVVAIATLAFTIIFFYCYYILSLVTEESHPNLKQQRTSNNNEDHHDKADSPPVRNPFTAAENRLIDEATADARFAEEKRLRFHLRQLKLKQRR